MSEEKAVTKESRLEAFTDAFESFAQTINRLENSYAELESRFTHLNERLQETNLRLTDALRENEKARSFLDNILSSVSSGILVYDCDGRISHCNAAAEKLLEVEHGELIGSGIEDVIESDTRPDICTHNTLDECVEYDSEEKILTLKSGKELPVAVSTSLMRDNSSEIIGAVEVIYDLSKVRKLEDEVSRVKALAALGEIAATVAHEVRNPLGGIAGFASLLKRDLPEDHPGQRMVDKIIVGVENLNRSVTSLLAYAHDIHLSPKEIHLKDFLSEIVTYFKADINHDTGQYAISVSSEPGDLHWRLDPEQFRQAIANLLYNAVQAMPDGGEVRLCASADESLMVEIADTGSGVDDETRDKMFTPFFTTKQGGTGLGLATVKKIVDAHRGRIEVVSTPGEGTAFRLYFPV